MDADGNPALPLWFDLAWMAGIVLWLLLVGVAWVSILRSNQARRGSVFWWCLLVLLMPISGALIWFVARPRKPDTDQRLSS
ncbi:PLDc N-terminal domain-containing protein [Rhodococcus sp. NPDC080181]|uniref:PLDc N-terminal domain-containing protein n=1 Tax=Nocardiaceae TaxID=85025 RepID=UPI001C91DD31|nr:PLDc N-terminal domain-containing protein [Rhodococcus fascians]MBY4240076.1 PLDc N-terminal domain-containing protein [Rhodococcus fascians]MBY4255694.1 PLDc N-terminal domain-containing protein [Rhodococcus fascians]MBY4271541.1 PLDc N-terminal domain-containing protein [Rhodococcus fascians]